MSIVTVQVSSGAERVASERRFDKGITILALKMKLEMITGSEAGHQDLRLYDCNNVEIGKMDNNDAMLGAYPIESGMRIHVIDTNPFKTRNEFGDVSKVEKFEMADEDYAKRSGLFGLGRLHLLVVIRLSVSRCLVQTPSWPSKLATSLDDSIPNSLRKRNKRSTNLRTRRARFRRGPAARSLCKGNRQNAAL
eukprot:m.48730 g.48730  ORF g.48730 m.48730 type:complete len:193 (+) comp47783_c0_seq3:100-678(+)